MNLKLEELVIEKIIFFIYTKQLSLKHLMVLPKHVQNKVFRELERHDKKCHNSDLHSCHAELLFKTCNDCDLENYDHINYSVITIYFKDHIRCISQDDPLFIKTLEMLLSNKL